MYSRRSVCCRCLACDRARRNRRVPPAARRGPAQDRRPHSGLEVGQRRMNPVRRHDRRPEEVRRQSQGQEHRERQVCRHPPGADQPRLQNDHGDRRRRPDWASVFKIAERFPKVKFAVVAAMKATARPNVAIYDVSKPRSPLWRAPPPRCVENRRRQLHRRPGDSVHRQCRQGIRSRHQIHQPQHQIFPHLI